MMYDDFYLKITIVIISRQGLYIIKYNYMIEK